MAAAPTATRVCYVHMVVTQCGAVVVDSTNSLPQGPRSASTKRNWRIADRKGRQGKDAGAERYRDNIPADGRSHTVAEWAPVATVQTNRRAAPEYSATSPFGLVSISSPDPVHCG